MNYPLISEYVEAIKAAEDNFDQLKHLRPVLDDDGMPVMSGGNFAVVFKMKDEQTGKLHAVKCFLKEQEGRAEAYRQIAEELEFVSSTFLTPIKYLDKELFVDSANSEDSEFPVLLMDWVEGQTLDKYIREHIDDQYELSLLAYQFSRLAMWLMPQPFAHGDLKPDNILVKEDGTLVLVDYDGMYVPAMKGQKARELGSPDFRHPGRTEEVFDEHIDDFSLASILLSLKAIALQPSLLEEYGTSDRLLFSEKDYRNLSESSALGALQPLMQDAELASLYSLYILALSQNNLSQVSSRLFNISRPDRFQYEDENLSTEVTEEDLANAWVDKYGAKYSRDWSALLIGPDIEVAKTMVINPNNFPEGDFWLSKPIMSKYTGETVYWCSNDRFHNGIILYLSRSIWGNLDDVNKHSVWNRITNGYYMIKEAHDIDTDEWLMDKNNQPIMMVAKIAEKAHGDWNGGSTTYFEELKETTIYSIKEGTSIISDYAFSNCKSLKQVVLPDSIQIIGRNVFKGCDSLQTIKISSESKEKFERLLPKFKDLFLFQYKDGIADLPFYFFRIMNYPLISEYVEAIKAAEDNFDQLKHLRPVLGEDGEPVMTSGNFAVVFKMNDEQTGKLHAVKCFLKEQEGRAEAYRQIAEELEYVSSTFLTPIKYLDKELFVDSANSEDSEFPVLLMDWVEGQTLDKYIREHIDDQYELSLLAYQFSRLAMWLMPQPFAHGDLKPDNILVKEDGTLVLVDYDGMYVPAMKGQKARELGSPDFRHPSRTEEVFDDHIDDFSLASILLSLKAIALQPALLEEYGASDRLLFSEKDYRNLSESSALGALQPLMQDAELASLYSLYILALSQNNLSQVSFRLFYLMRPKDPEPINIDPYVTNNDLYYARIDEYGVKYSKDWKRLLYAPADLSDYIIKRGTKVICSYAFEGCKKLKTIKIPDSVTIIGTSAFEDCDSLTMISIPRIREIPSGAFANCINLHSLVIPDSVTYIGIAAFYGCAKLESIIIPKSITKIEQSAFEKCSNLISVSIPQGVEFIDDSVFCGCSALKTISFPLSLKSIGNEAFCRCNSLTSLIFPENIEILSANCFARCGNLKHVDLPKSLSFIGENAFEGCGELRKIEIPNRVKEIKDSTFQECGKLQSISFGHSIMKIGKHAFEGCLSLSSVSLPNSLKVINDYAFDYCI